MDPTADVLGVAQSGIAAQQAAQGGRGRGEAGGREHLQADRPRVDRLVGAIPPAQLY
jgi:hypothetical protein